MNRDSSCSRIQWYAASASWLSVRSMIPLIALFCLLAPVAANANPYLAKPGEPPVSIHVATCAVSGGFTHLYTALANALFDKYRLKIDHRFISGTAAKLAALSAHGGRLLSC